MLDKAPWALTHFNGTLCAVSISVWGLFEKPQEALLATNSKSGLNRKYNSQETSRYKSCEITLLIEMIWIKRLGRQIRDKMKDDLPRHACDILISHAFFFSLCFSSPSSLSPFPFLISPNPNKH